MPSRRLVIYVDFEDDSDFDFYRGRFVGEAEEMAYEITEGEHDSLPQSDGKVEVSWDTEDVID